MKADTQRGFSLTELLTVIAVISILAGLLLPAVSSAKKKAHAAYCRSNLRQIGVALTSYAYENETYPPYADFTSDRKWYTTLKPYLPNGWSNGVYVCPPYRGMTFDGGIIDGGLYSSAGSYGWNIGSSDALDQYHYGLLESYPFLYFGDTPIREDAIVSPSDFYVVGDSFSRSYSTPDPIVEGAEFLTRRLHNFGDRPIGKKVKAASKRHEGYGQMLFADAHAEALRLQTLLMSTNAENLRRWHTDHEAHRELFR